MADMQRLQQQIEDMEQKIGGSGGDMQNMMAQLQQLQEQTELISKAAGGLGGKGKSNRGEDNQLIDDY